MTVFSNTRVRVWAAAFLIVAMALLSAACSTTTSAAIPPAPPEMGVAQVVQKDIPIYREWIGTLDGMVNAAIKAQVSGYLLTQNYTEGSFVKKGQLLFEIDPRPFQAAVDQAQGQLAQANGQLAQANAQLVQARAQLAQSEANQVRTQLDVDRYVPLAKQQAITQQDLDNATQNNLSAKAQVEASKAQVETAKAQIQAANAAVEAAKAAMEAARVNLGFTRLTSPIDGIVGQAQVQVGNLVGPTSGTITTVSTLEPIKANFTVSEQEYLDFTRRASNELTRLQLELILADGSVYPHKGKFLFADRQVNQDTGAILLIGLFPNPGNVLRPGQYAKVRAATAVKQGALLVPQRAVTELQGSYQVAVVDSDNKVNVKTVKVGDRVGSLWIVDEGLKPGDRVIAEGVQKVRSGMVVTPKLDVASAEAKEN
ncbi:MAG TPA: efflux RND transporter periplasmic adaptor subunit [Bryobacteraceae bacterium]|nr:efflux RND transporter periplasmic adaptor subunit [Bryobacteraceae bacterium]